LIIEFQRAFTPEEMYEDECGVCGLRFRCETVIVQASVAGWGSAEVGRVCRDCIEYLHNRNPERFPSIGEYEVLLLRYPEPIWPSVEESARCEIEEPDVRSELEERSWIGRL